MQPCRELRNAESQAAPANDTRTATAEANDFGAKKAK